MSISSPSNDISSNAPSPKSASITSVSGTESTKAAMAMLLQAQSVSISPQRNAEPLYSSQHIAQPPAVSMVVDSTSALNLADQTNRLDGSPTQTSTNSILQDLALQQRMLQVKHQQMIQQNLLEQNFHRNREMLQVEHERQLSIMLQQVRILMVKLEFE